MTGQDKTTRRSRPDFPVSPPVKPAPRDAAPRDGDPDLRIEEIEEKHIPKDRNIFDK